MSVRLSQTVCERLRVWARPMIDELSEHVLAVESAPAMHLMRVPAGSAAIADWMSTYQSQRVHHHQVCVYYAEGDTGWRDLTIVAITELHTSADEDA